MGANERRPPNFVVIFCDNLGYGDLGCYGHPVHRTLNVDRMAQDGMRFTDFYVSSPVCTPSRASIMTGCYAQRVDLHISDKGTSVLQPVAAKGLSPDEITIAEVLRDVGYTTACIGKWHLGDQPEFLPTRQGFDYYYGIPYSEDMYRRPDRDWPELPLMRGAEVIEAPVDLDTITERYTHEAVQFMTENRERPFFLYLPEALPGSLRWPQSGPRFAGRSGNWGWGDTVEELDWSAGQVIRAVQRLGVERDTLVIFLSDNGAPDHGGSNGPLHGWGYSTWEAGMRVPCVMRWPGTIPASTVCSEVATTMDLMPTCARLAGTTEPQDRVIDGHDIRPLMTGEKDACSPYHAFFYYFMEQLQAVRCGRWKLHLARPNRRVFGDQQGPPAEEPLLFDLVVDPGETTNVTADHPDVVAGLNALAEEMRADLGDTGMDAPGRRPAGWVENPTPRVMGDDSGPAGLAPCGC